MPTGKSTKSCCKDTRPTYLHTDNPTTQLHNPPPNDIKADVHRVWLSWPEKRRRFFPGVWGDEVAPAPSACFFFFFFRFFRFFFDGRGMAPEGSVASTITAGGGGESSAFRFFCSDGRFSCTSFVATAGSSREGIPKKVVPTSAGPNSIRV